MKILVTGSRSFPYTRKDEIWHLLDQYLDKVTLLIHGAARGADTLSDAWAKNNHIMRDPFPADWHLHGKAAGAIRNRKMLETHPDIALVLAFPLSDSVGTLDMIEIARNKGIKVIVWTNENKS